MNTMINKVMSPFKIRTTLLDGKFWFAARDIFDAIGVRTAYDGGSTVNSVLNQIEVDTSQRRVVSLDEVGGDKSWPARGLICLTIDAMQQVLTYYRDRHDKPAAKRLAAFMNAVEPQLRASMGNTKEPKRDTRPVDGITLDEYRALYLNVLWDAGVGAEVGKSISSLCRTRGVEPTKKQTILFRKDGGCKAIEVNVYPKALLDEVFAPFKAVCG